ncbi:hypothetical protein JCM6882_006519 [Rhodosporidiobolus microsporus]
MHAILSLLAALPLAVPVLSSPLQLPFLSPTSPCSTAASSAFLDKAHRVSLQLGVMSRCPDAHLCEAVFERVLETQVEVQFEVLEEEGKPGNGTRREKRKVEVRELVDLSTLYIARENTTAEEYGVTCMHGALECRGNVQQLCAAKYWNDPGRKDPKDVEQEEESAEEEFVQCINYGETSSIGTDRKAKECAKIVGREWTDALTACTDPSTRSEGSHLLLSSVREAKKLEVQKSCTILIEKNKVCIHDSTWQSCPAGHAPADFAKQIRQEWESLNARDGKREE